MSAEPMEPRPGIVAGIDLGKLREVVPRDLALRFAFGAGISIIAGLAGLLVSSRFGGMFLAFPAILPATLTLLEKTQKNEAGSAALRSVLTAPAAAVGPRTVRARTTVAAIRFTHLLRRTGPRPSQRFTGLTAPIAARPCSRRTAP